MMEKIKLLANQAHEYAVEQYEERIKTEGQSNVLFYEIRDNKFAELITVDYQDEIQRLKKDIQELQLLLKNK